MVADAQLETDIMRPRAETAPLLLLSTGNPRLGNPDLPGPGSRTAARKPPAPSLPSYLQLTVEIRSVRGEDIV